MTEDAKPQSFFTANRARQQFLLVTTRNMGLPVYRRLGFQQYCEIQHYMWMNDAAED